MEKDIAEQFIETIPVERQAFFWVGMYYYLARAAIAVAGGEKVIREAIRCYGRERGTRRRNIVLAKGLELNLLSLFQNGDLNGDNRFESYDEQCILTEETRRHFVKRCPDAEMWAELGDLKIGAIYCEEIHHQLYGAFDDAVQVNLCETLTNGGKLCRFYINCRNANKNEQCDKPYLPQSWEDTGKDGVKCNFTMFALFYFHLAKLISEKLGNNVLLKGIRDFATQRGKRMRELERRENREANISNLLTYGDLFLDPRFVLTREQNAEGETVTIKRCVFAEVMKCHHADELGQLYCQEIYKGILSAYAPENTVKIESCLCQGCDCCKIKFLFGK